MGKMVTSRFEYILFVYFIHRTIYKDIDDIQYTNGIQ